MPPRKLAAIFFMLCAIAGSAPSHSQPVKKLTIALTRHADDDLEVTGMVAGLSAGEVGYVSYAELIALPQITTTIQNDSNFADQPSRGVRITGIRLEQLAKALGALPESDLPDVVGSALENIREHIHVIL